MKFGKTHILLVLATLFATTTIGVSTYLYTTIDKMRATYAQTTTDIAKESNRQIQILKIKKQLVDIEDERARLGEYFFHESDDVKLIEQLENLAKHAQVEMDVSTAAVVGEQIKVFRVSFKIKGDWDRVMYYLSLLEALPSKITITSTRLSGAKETAWSGDVTFDLLSFIPNEGISS